MTPLLPQIIKTLCAGVWLARADGARGELPGVSIDSRTIRPGEVFIAIKGDTHDGHVHAAAAARTAGLLIVERDIDTASLPPGVGVLKVPSTRRALGQIAHAHRRALVGAKVIAVCGSNGKTTTVRLIDAILRTRLRGVASVKSYNNDIGVPVTLLGARAADQYVICEVGTNAPGEIGALGAIVEPDVAVITSIGREHLQGLGSIEGVASEEAAILRAVRRGGLAIVPADAPALRPHLPGASQSGGEGRTHGGVSYILFGDADDADLRLTEACHQWCPRPCGGAVPELRFTVNGRWPFTLPLVGRHNACNALAAIAVARRLGIDDESIGRALSIAGGAEMRWQHAVIGGVEVINDAYNANPDSMLASLATFADLYGGTALQSRVGACRTIILGNMLELGDHAAGAHREIGEAIAHRRACDRLFTIGDLAALAAEACTHAASGAIEVETLPDLTPDAVADLAARFSPGDVVLLKGSRGNRLERIVAALTTGGTALQSRESVHI